MFKKIIRYTKDPYYALGYDLIKKRPRWMSDEFYIKVLWKMLMGYKLDLKSPKTFNEKLQWLKLHDHNQLYTTLVDKYRVKQYVTDKIGAEHVIPTLAVYNNANEIDIDKLPDQFVLKCNHDSGSVVICREKSTFDLEAAKLKLNTALHHNFYWDAREWSYKNVPPLVFAEKYMESSESPNHKDLLTYKFICLGGNPEIMYITVKNDDVWENYYNMDFEPLNISRNFPRSVGPLDKPVSFSKMQDIAKELSKGFPQVRIDLYEVDGTVYFSEYTFYDWAGLIKFKPADWDDKLGDMIVLPK